MNKENAREFLPLVQALAEGKAIEGYFEIDEKWRELVEVRFDAPVGQYRIKPEPREIFVVNDDEDLAYWYEEDARRGVEPPEGWVLVPSRPTFAMIGKGGAARRAGGYAVDVYVAMLSARPEVP